LLNCRSGPWGTQFARSDIEVFSLHEDELCSPRALTLNGGSDRSHLRLSSEHHKIRWAIPSRRYLTATCDHVAAVGYDALRLADRVVRLPEWARQFHRAVDRLRRTTLVTARVALRLLRTARAVAETSPRRGEPISVASVVRSSRAAF
jgi:hypothetical protein